MPPRDSIQGTLLIATILCFVCSLFVAATTVGLKSIQDENKLISTQKTLLSLAGLIDESKRPLPSNKEIADTFNQKLEPHIVDLATGNYAADEKKMLADKWDQKKALLDSNMVVKIPANKDLGDIKEREKFSYVYLVRGDGGKIEQVILPIRGKGLWSTLWGYISLAADGETVKGLVFTDHAETPGLGGEIENPSWRHSWIGKDLSVEENKVQITAVKGGVDASDPNAKHQFDSLAGATITSRGVEHLLKYWLGPEGFHSYIEHVKSGELK
jgi:Na+-transporting NADH:ubiquinone oxidoreductase subunit C